MSVNLQPALPPGNVLPGKNNRPGSPVANDPSAPRPNTPGMNSPKNPSSRPNTPGPVKPAIKKKYAAEFLEEEEKNDETILSLQALAKEEWMKRGPLCDSEGFYQHTGECWNDAIQQILCNADGLKEVVQPIYVFWRFGVTEFETMPDFAFVPHHLHYYPNLVKEYLEKNKEIINELKKWMTLYLRESQKRFLRHYILETKRRVLKQELCAIEGSELGEVARAKIKAISTDPAFRAKGVQAQKSALFGKLTNMRGSIFEPANKAKYEQKPTLEEYIAKDLAGGMDDDDEYILNTYNSLFFKNRFGFENLHRGDLNYKSEHLAKFKEDLQNTTAVHFGARRISTKKGITKVQGHALAFYQCGNQELFYEDNYGIFPLPWRDILYKYVELIGQDMDPKLEFTKLTAVNKEQNLSFYTSFCPIITYKDKEEKYHALLNFTGEFVDANEKSEKEFVYVATVEGTKIKLVYTSNDAWELKQLLFIRPINSQDIANTSFEFNRNSRIDKHPIVLGILRGDEEGALDAIELEQVINPNLVIKEEGSPDEPVLLSALKYSLWKVALALIEKGYSIDFKDEYRNTPLQIAIILNQPDIVAALIRRDPSILTNRDEFGKEAISLAAFEQSNLQILKVLVELGANIETQTNIGRTPLFFASREGNLEGVKYLCSIGANPLARDKGNPEANEPPRTPIDVAKTPEIKEILTTQCGKTGGRRNRKQTRRRKARKARKTRRM